MQKAKVRVKNQTANADSTLAALGQSAVLKDPHLAGGTALALQLGHRVSVDFDFFTPTAFDPQHVIQQLAKLVYFEDAEADPDLNMLGEIPWDAVKKFFTRDVRRLTAELLRE